MHLFFSHSHRPAALTKSKSEICGPSMQMRIKLVNVSFFILFLSSVFVIFISEKPLSQSAVDTGRVRVTARSFPNTAVSHFVNQVMFNLRESTYGDEFLDGLLGVVFGISRNFQVFQFFASKLGRQFDQRFKFRCVRDVFFRQPINALHSYCNCFFFLSLHLCKTVSKPSFIIFLLLIINFEMYGFLMMLTLFVLLHLVKSNAFAPGSCPWKQAISSRYFVLLAQGT